MLIVPQMVDRLHRPTGRDPRMHRLAPTIPMLILDLMKFEVSEEDFLIPWQGFYVLIPLQYISDTFIGQQNNQHKTYRTLAVSLH